MRTGAGYRATNNVAPRVSSTGTAVELLKRVWTLKQWLFQDIPKLDAIADFTNSPRGGFPERCWSCEASSGLLSVTGGRIMLGDV